MIFFVIAKLSSIIDVDVTCENIFADWQIGIHKISEGSYENFIQNLSVFIIWAEPQSLLFFLSDYLVFFNSSTIDPPGN